MALSKSEIAQFQSAVDRYLETHRPPSYVRGEIDFRARVRGQSVEIYKICPGARGRPGSIRKDGVAKATYVKSRGTWKLYAQGEDLNWRRFDPDKEYPSLEAILSIVERDKQGCFYG